MSVRRGRLSTPRPRDCASKVPTAAEKQGTHLIKNSSHFGAPMLMIEYVTSESQCVKREDSLTTQHNYDWMRLSGGP
ncbi:hypothetical protein J6590_027605 [Homalodisca vitripennis]|nr:hypothetical protein J6590_027605 [Homalodisca vitripennis]